MEEITLLKQALKEEIAARQAAEKALEIKTAEASALQASLEKVTLQNNALQDKSAIDYIHTSARLSSLIANLDAAILVEDENRKILLVNQKFCDLFHIPALPHELIGADCSDSADQAKPFFKNPDQFIHRINEILSSKKRVLGDQLEMVNGILLKRDFVPVFNEDKYLGHLWTYEDITGIASVNKRIESLSRFPKESPSPILRCSPNGDILYANLAAKIFVVAMTTSLFNEKHKKAKEQILENITQANLTREIIKTEITIRHKVFNLMVVPVENEEYINIYATDITDIKAAESKINLLKELMDQMDEFIQVIDKDGKFVFINKPSADRFGKTPEQLIGLNIKHFVSSFYLNMTWEEQFEYFKKQGSYRLSSTHTRADGRSYPLEASIKHTLSNDKEYIISFSNDISERKNAEEALKKQKQFYEDILNNIPSDIAVYNTDSEYLFVNPAAIKDEEIRKWIIGKNDFDYCLKREKNSSIAVQRQEKIRTVLREKKSLEWEDAIKTPEGEISYHLRRSQPVLDENENIKLIIGYGLNITEMKRVQEKLAKSEELHRLVIYATNDGIWDWDIESGTVFFSERWKKMLGYQDDELRNHVDTWEKVMHPDDFTIAIQILKDHFEKRSPFSYKLRYLHKDGSTRWIMYRGFAIRHSNGKAYRMVGSCTDVTETVVAESLLKESENKFSAIFNNSHDAKFLVDNETNTIIDCNERALELFETDKAELVNRSAKELRKNKLTNSEYQEIKNQLNTKGYWSQEVLYATKKGNAFWGNIVAKNIRINNKDISIARITDITERKNNEQELIKAKKIAEDSKKAKEIFLANMSHEIRTPMNGIIGMTGLLSNTKLDESQHNYIRLIKNSADNLLVIINDILDTAKIESGKLTLEQIPFDICEVTKNAIQTLIYKAEEKGILLKMHPIALEHTIVIGDPYRLTQIWINLINNAIKFTENGSVEISGRMPRNTTDEITFEFTVSDTGIGIAEEKLNSIFEGFTQASDDTSRKFGGTGLGLTICKDLIQLQGGNIWVKSTLGKGSEFIFSLTYKKGELEVSNKEHQENPAALNLGKLKILLAEDNEVNQFLAKTILTGWSFDVDIANNGIEAVKLIEENEYDIVLMDIQMPHMGGIEATKIIRAQSNKIKANTPIIALTANALSGDAEKYIEAGMNDYLSKPFEREKLFSKIADNVNPLIKHTEHVAQPKTSSTFESSDLPDYSYLETNFNNRAFLKEIFNIFIETTPKMVEAMKQALAEKDYDSVQAAAHKLKSSIDSFRIQSIKKTIRDIEQHAAKKTELDQLPLWIEEAEEKLHRVNEDLIEKLKEY